MTDTFIFDESAYAGVKERADRRVAAKAKTTADKSAFVSSYQASMRLGSDFVRDTNTTHRRGGEGNSLFSDYLDVSIRKNVNLKASGHD